MNTSKFQLERTKGAPVSSDELIADIRRVAELTEIKIISQKLYAKFGRYDPTTASRRFGSWNQAVIKAGLEVANEINYTDDQLYENLMLLWEHSGRQPRRAELALPPSLISQSPYTRRFRTWANALEKFVAYANSQEIMQPLAGSAAAAPRTRRDPSLRLRFWVMKRDNFSCRACGGSPALHPGLSLHVDHIKAWSLGGGTVEDNLQTLCEPCNLGKSNVL